MDTTFLPVHSYRLLPNHHCVLVGLMIWVQIKVLPIAARTMTASPPIDVPSMQAS